MFFQCVVLGSYYAGLVYLLAVLFLILFSPFFSLEAMSHPAAGTPLSLTGQTAALLLQLTLRPLNISMFQVGADTIYVLVSCHHVERSLCSPCLVSISHALLLEMHTKLINSNL